MHLHHRVDDFKRSAGVADPETGHRERLGESVQKDGPLLHAGQRGDRRKNLSGVGQFGIDQVGQNDQIMFPGDFGNGLQLVHIESCAGRVARKVQENGLGFRCDGFFQIGGIQRKIVFLVGRHRDRHAVCHPDFGVIGDIAGFVVDDLVARIRDRADCQVQRLADADRDDAFMHRIIFHLVIFRHIVADGFAQREQAQIGGVARMAAFQRVDRPLPDRPRRDEIRFSDSEGDHIVHRVDQFEKVADPAFREGDDMLSKFGFQTTG